jgi:YggT family protein
MFVFENMVATFATILGFCIKIYMWIIIARCLLSWVNPDPYNAIVVFIYRITEPLLSFVRRKIPFATVSALDLSPVIVILLLWFLQEFLFRTLMDISIRLH